MGREHIFDNVLMFFHIFRVVEVELPLDSSIETLSSKSLQGVFSSTS